MSELQVALLILGAIVILAVVIYNRVQEARFRARAESAFATDKTDARLAAPEPVRTNGQERIEPQFQESDEHPIVTQERREPIALGTDDRLHDEPVPVRVAAEATVLETAAAPLQSSPPAPREAAQAPAVAPPAAVVAAPPVVVPVADAPEPAPESPTPAEDDPLCYPAEIHAARPIVAALLDQLRRSLGTLIDRTRIEAWNEAGGRWLAVGHDYAPARSIRLWLQLVDRRGTVTPQDLALFQSAVARCAAGADARSVVPPTDAYLARARELDAFCAEVDVIVGINISAPRGRPFQGTRVRGVLEAAGFQPEQDRFVYRDTAGATRFALESQDHAALTPETLRSAQVSGLTLLFDVPRQADGVTCFNQMVMIGRQLAQSLGGMLVDDNGTPVTDAGLEQIRNQLRAIYGNMEARGMQPGSSLAQRLFG